MAKEKRMSHVISHVTTLSAVLFMVTVFMSFMLVLLKSKPEKEYVVNLHTVSLYGRAFAPGGVNMPTVDYFSFPPVGFFNWYGSLDTDMCFQISSLTVDMTDLDVNHMTLYSSNTGFSTFSEIDATGGELCYSFNEKLYGPISEASLTLHLHHTSAFATPTFEYGEQWTRAFLRSIYDTYFPQTEAERLLGRPPRRLPEHFF